VREVPAAQAASAAASSPTAAREACAQRRAGPIAFPFASHSIDSSIVLGKLRVSGAEVRRVHDAKPMAYGLGKSGWISIVFDVSVAPPLETIKRWVMESYRAQAPKRLLKELETEQPWVAAGGLPR
jgi:hypothetical protein